jgi:hypothetical protein
MNPQRIFFILSKLGISPGLLVILSHLIVAYNELQYSPYSVSKAMEYLLEYDYPDYPNEFEVPSASSLMRELQTVTDKELVRDIILMLERLFNDQDLIAHVGYLRESLTKWGDYPTQQPNPIQGMTNPKIIRFQVWDVLLEMHFIARYGEFFTNLMVFVGYGVFGLLRVIGFKI